MEPQRPFVRLTIVEIVVLNGPAKAVAELLQHHGAGKLRTPRV
jgi:hypothetical protein